MGRKSRGDRFGGIARQEESDLKEVGGSSMATGIFGGPEKEKRRVLTGRIVGTIQKI